MLHESFEACSENTHGWLAVANDSTTGALLLESICLTRNMCQGAIYRMPNHPSLYSWTVNALEPTWSSPFLKLDQFTVITSGPGTPSALIGAAMMGASNINVARSAAQLLGVELESVAVLDVELFDRSQPCSKVCHAIIRNAR